MKHNHYFKDVTRFDYVDVYRVLELFNVTNPCLQHAVKKLLVAGGRGAGKNINQDIQEAIDTLVRWKEMQTEGLVAKVTKELKEPRFVLVKGNCVDCMFSDEITEACNFPGEARECLTGAYRYAPAGDSDE
ncbi:MAG: hypothetical protein DRQ89_14160 [Epsilonproteobacteria bacterium]|nr:MAG: hypothetical protein DRQ89_14160 [Campylobacterota bacterium]